MGRQSQLLEQHQQHPPTTHNNKDDTVDDAKYGSRPRNYSNRETVTTISTRDCSSFGTGTDDDDDDDECYWHVDASTRLPRRPSFNSKKNNDDDKDREREQEYSSRQREHQALGRVQKRLHHLQVSHEELQQQNETIISLLENMTVVSQNNSLN